MSYLDGLFYRRLWPAPLHLRVERAPSPTPAPEESTPVRAASPLLDTSFADTVPEVAAAEQAVADRLADLVDGGLSPLEAARRLFVEGDAS